jgi:hypothetical protein
MGHLGVRLDSSSDDRTRADADRPIVECQRLSMKPGDRMYVPEDKEDKRMRIS